MTLGTLYLFLLPFFVFLSLLGPSPPPFSLSSLSSLLFLNSFLSSILLFPPSLSSFSPSFSLLLELYLYVRSTRRLVTPTAKVTNVMFFSLLHLSLDLLPFASEKLPRSTGHPTQATGTEIHCLPSCISDTKWLPFALASCFGSHETADNSPSVKTATR